MIRIPLAGALALILSIPVLADGGHSVGYQGATAPSWSAVQAYRDASGNLQQVTPSTPLPVTGSTGSTSSTYTVTRSDCSGTITAADAAQELIAANSTGFMWELQALSSNASSIYFRDDGSDAEEGAGSFELTAGQTIVTDQFSTQSVSVIGATAGDAFTCKIVTKN